MAESRAASAMGGKKKSKKTPKKGKSKGKKPHEMHIRHAANGGYIVKHDFKNQQDPEEHQIPDMEALQQHVQDHMDQSEPAGAAGAGPMPMPQEEPRGGM